MACDNLYQIFPITYVLESDGMKMYINSQKSDLSKLYESLHEYEIHTWNSLPYVQYNSQLITKFLTDFCNYTNLLSQSRLFTYH